MFIELLAATTDTAACELRNEQVIVLSDDNIRVRDILDLSCNDGKYSGAGDLVIASAPERSKTLTVARSGLADLVRRRVPGLAEVLGAESGGSITFRWPANTEAGAGLNAPCFATVRRVAAGELLTHDSVAPTSCEADQSPARLNYDRRYGVVRAAGALERGEFLGRLMTLPRLSWDGDQPLMMSIRIGPVTIEREVEAVAPVGGSASAFVRDVDGAIFSAPVSALVKSEARHD